MADVTALPPRPSAAALVTEQTRYALRGFWRTPIAAFFTIAFPVLFVVLIGLIAGDAVVDPATGVRVTQFTTPGMMAFAVAMATFTTPAIGVAIAREQGVLKRLRGTPMPSGAYLAGRVVAAVLVALIAVVLMLLVAVVAFDVQVFARTLPQAVGVLVVAAAAFAAMAFGVVALVPSSAMVQMVTTGAVTTLGFVSDIFLVGGQMPGWLVAVGDAFPLKHLAALLRDAFHPFDAPPFGWDHLGVVVGWGLVGAVIAVWRFSWQPPAAPVTASQAHGREVAAPTPPVRRPAAATLTVAAPGRPSWTALTAGQVRYASLLARRDAGAVFFAVLFPVLLVLLLPAVFGDGELDGFGLPFAQVLGPAMTAYGIAVHAFVNVPEQLARAREDGVLKRLAGTPMPTSAHLAGRLVSALGVALLIAVLTLGAAAVAWGMDVPASRVPVALVVLLLGTTSLTALGALVASIVPSAQAVPPVSLGLLLPLAFVSDVFSFAPLPTALQAIGWAFPLKPFVHALLQSLDAASSPWAWAQLAALAAWGVLGAVLALRRSHRIV